MTKPRAPASLQRRIRHKGNRTIIHTPSSQEGTGESHPSPGGERRGWRGIRPGTFLLGKWRLRPAASLRVSGAEESPSDRPFSRPGQTGALSSRPHSPRQGRGRREGLLGAAPASLPRFPGRPPARTPPQTPYSQVSAAPAPPRPPPLPAPWR